MSYNKERENLKELKKVVEYTKEWMEIRGVSSIEDLYKWILQMEEYMKDENLKKRQIKHRITNTKLKISV